jgi:hypothetical protein
VSKLFIPSLAPWISLLPVEPYVAPPPSNHALDSARCV